MLNDPMESVEEKRAGERRSSGGRSRRTYTLDFKLRVLQETTAPGASIAAVALRHNMNTNVVFRWRKLLRQGRLTGESGTEGKVFSAPAFAPVRVVPDVPAVRTPGAEGRVRTEPGSLVVTLPGGFTLRVEGDVDETALRKVLRAVRELT